MCKLGIVITFERNQNGTFKPTGRTKILPYGDALNLYAEIPNPASQLIEGDTTEEVMLNAEKRIKEMSDKAWLNEYLEPYL